MTRLESFPRHPHTGRVCFVPVGACAEEHHAPRHVFPVDARGAAREPSPRARHRGEPRAVLERADYLTTSARVVTR